MVSPVTRPQAETRRFRGRLGRRLALILLPLVVIPLMAMGIGAYLRSRALLEEQATSQMSAATQAQIQVLAEWSAEREQRLQLGAQRPPLQQAAADLIALSPQSQLYTAALETALAELNDIRIRQGQTLFSDLLIAQPSSGLILAATQEDWSGRITPNLTSQALPPSGQLTLPLFNDPVLASHDLAFLTLAPFRAAPPIAEPLLLVGVNQGPQLAQLLEQMQIFWEQRGVYRVERGRTFMLLEPDILVQLPRYAMAPEAVSGHQHPIFPIAEGTPAGTLEYVNADGNLVLAAYEWIPEWNLGIVAELPQADIFAEINQLAPFSIALIAGASLFTVVVVVLVARQLLRPLGNLSDLAERLTRGEWTYRVPEDRDDEIGALAHSLNQMAEELSDAYRSLEQRVEERTRQIRTASEVARAVISTPSLDDLLRRAVELIQRQFHYDYVSIFLLEEEGDFVQLREATGDIGGALKAQGYIVPVGSQSLIGWVTGSNQPRILSDIQPEAAPLRRDLMPETRSELAVPLQTGGRVLGAIDVQSSAPDAFGPQDVEVLQTLADQLSAAILNARLTELSATAADRARLVSEVTQALSGAMEIEEVLEKAARALQHGLGSPEVLIKIHGDDAGLAPAGREAQPG